MKALTMFANHLSGTLPSTMGLFLPNLMKLLLGENELDGIIPSSISNASKLAFLDLSDNSFTGFIPSSLGNLRHLQGLNLANNHLTIESSTSESSFLTTLANCKELRKVVLSGNPLNITLPTSIGNLSTSLEQFLANNCNSKGIIPREISNLTSLIALSLANNQFSGNIPTTIGKLEKLQVLYLQGNKLQGTIMYDLCRLRSLAYLSFGGNKLVGSIPECLGNITSLQSLNLSSNNLNFTIPSTFWNLKYILTISMSSNFLSGFISSDIGNLTVVENIDLSSNKLSGEIPSSIGKLESLTHLSLAKNGLHGPIPESISFLKGLEFLDLSYNNLSGVIPKSLEKFLYLQHFNVSFNGLEGEIPNEGPFSNFSAKSYMMNYALCGAPRLLVPHCKSGTGAQPRFVFILKLTISLIVSILLVYYILLWSKFRKRNMPSIAPNLSLKTSFPSTEPNRRYTYLEFQQATDWFSEDNLIGIGHFSSVYKGKLKDGKEVAIKVFNVEEETSLRSFDLECEVFSRVSHPNLVRTVCISNSINFKALVMEYMANGSLEKWLHTHKYDLDILQRVDIMIETAKAVRYLHQRCIIHCDIKPSNIILDEDMVAHVSDFSIAKIQPVSRIRTIQSKLMCTIGYVAPEYGRYGIVSASMDVYSFGILLMETFTGKKPTHEMFTGEMNLRRWVIESLPCEVERVIDPSLLQTEEENNDVYMKCISSVMRLALICSAESPSERLNMRDVEEKLNNIRFSTFR
uniref:non-specific serine/threonine protein kinase n=1 Tax=Vernicia montana TaxID=316732 RepID=A0A140G4S5_9ROSI|nr:LRR-RLK [Vernicia montana]